MKKSKPKPFVLLSSMIYEGAVNDHLKGRARIHVARNEKDFVSKLPLTDGVITNLTQKVDRRILARATKAKVIGNNAIGVDNIDLEECKKRKIKVVNTPDVLTRSTAELALCLLLAAARRLPEGEWLCRNGKFTGWRPDMLLGLELKGRQAVIVGKGRIGKEVGRLFRSNGMKVKWITGQSTPNQIKRALREAQVLSINLPLRSETKHWLNKTKIALLPRDSIVINTARGPVVDEQALIDALKKRKIFAAGLDVYEREPAIPTSLRKLPNVVLLPHLGSATHLARYKMSELAIRGVLSVLEGKNPKNRVV